MNIENLVRVAAVACIMTASSCAVTNGGDSISADGAVNHPITVEPSFREIKLGYGGPDGMTTDDAIKFDAFLADYRAHGNGSLGISVPSGPSNRTVTTFFAERAAATGISRDKILVSSQDSSSGDKRVGISYITYVARSQECGDWSENLAFAGDNLVAKNFGCSVQRNMAAMVANPRDLLGPRPMEPVSAARRATVMDKYEKGEPSQAIKKTYDSSVEQSAPGSGVGN